MISKRTSSSRNSFTDDDSDFDENTIVVKKTSTSRKKSYKKWTKDEDERLKEYINSHNHTKDWSRISQYVGNGRTDAQCQHRWERFLDPSITKGPWTDEEDRKVIELVRDYGARQWSLIAKELKGRVGKQCRERWHNHLNPAINKNPWTNDENFLLFILHQHFGNKWAEIARHFNGRSDNSIKNHWNSSMKKKFELEVANLKRQGLAWTALIPPDFLWPKLDKKPSRPPLTIITNHSNSKEIVEEKPIINSDHQFYSSTTENNFDLPPIYSEEIPIKPSTDSQPSRSSQDLERLFYCTPPSPIKPLPMLSSCADYTTTSSQNSQTNHPQLTFLDYYSSSQTTNRTTYSTDDSFSINFNSQNEIKQENQLIDITQNQNIVISPKTISNTSSPSKHRVLNTPERLDQPHRTEQDWFNDFVGYVDPIRNNNTTDNLLSVRPTIVRKNKRLHKYSSTVFETKKRLFNSSKKLSEELEYNPTYREILLGQTADQRYITEQARRYLSCSSLTNYNI